MAAGSPIDRLATQLAALQRQVNALGKGTALAYSSIDNGALTATQTSTDSFGNSVQQVTTIIGQQYDGTAGAVVVSGPPPPRPSAPTLSQAIGGVKVQWDGTFMDPQQGFSSPVVAPMDFAGVDVQVSADLNFGDGGFGPTHGTIVSAKGGELFVAWPQSNTPLYARLITRTKAGKYSPPSMETGPIHSGQVQLGDLGFPIAQYSGGNTIYYTVSPATPTAPSWGFSAGDLWLDQIGTATGQAGGAPQGTPLYQTSRWGGSQWVLLQDQGVSSALASAITAQSTANGKAQVFTQPTKPTYSGAANTAYWIDTAHDNVTNVWNGTDWTPYTLGNGAITPGALIASDVLATGTVTAALLEASLVLASAIIAGDPTGTHAAMRADGFRVFDASGNEIIRLGTSSNDYFGVVDTSGKLVASIDETGQGNFHALTVETDPIIQGTSLSQLLTTVPGGGGAGTSLPGARNWVGWDGTSVINGVTGEVGIIEMAIEAETDRIYWIVPSLYWTASDTSTYLTVTVRDGGTSAPTVNSPVVSQDFFSTGNNASWTLLAERHRAQRFTTAGQHRLLLTVAAGGSGSVNVITTGDGQAPTLEVIDLGPDYGNPATTNRGGGGTPAPTQQYYAAESPTGHWSFRGNGTLRTDTTDVVQGYDPTGYNGDGKGGWNFNVPSITGTVNRVDLYIYNNWAYYNSGAQALIALVNDASTASPTVLRGSWNPGVTYPKPGGVTVTLPSAWYGNFMSRSSVGLYLGPSGGTNETFYMRADGPSSELRIWYTQ